MRRKVWNISLAAAGALFILLYLEHACGRHD
ncbi:hypothetical protein QFZ72_003951 [Bacillus sp. V2I10]|nr:hypothetical protein [Bacillus sp. V2I10]